MNVTVNVICYKSKVLKNNESPLMVRVCKDRKRKYISLGISVNPTYWDFKKNAPKPQCPNKEYLDTLIAKKVQEYSAQIIELKAMDKDFTATTLVEKVSKPTKLKTIGEMFLEQIQLLKDEKRTGYMLTVKQTYNSLIKFNSHLNIYFPDLDVAWLNYFDYIRCTPQPRYCFKESRCLYIYYKPSIGTQFRKDYSNLLGQFWQ